MGIIKSVMRWKSSIVFTVDEEEKALKEAVKFIEEEVGAKVTVIREEDAPEQMKEKAGKSLPGKPSILLE
jgi:phosphotransacetylase